MFICGGANSIREMKMLNLDVCKTCKRFDGSSSDDFLKVMCCYFDCFSVCLSPTIR